MSADTDKLLALARECGMAGPLNWPAPGLYMGDASSLAALEQRITDRERERAVQLCEQFMTDDMPGPVLGRTLRLIAAIRSSESEGAR